tara:strand:+ start:1916 stop:2386 length:471 start_codon:yes stop_codon:yes gene_type:complete
MDLTENYLDEESLKKLNINLNSNTFPWFWVKKIQGVDNINNYHFVHDFYTNDRICSHWFPLMESFISLIKPKALIRIKANLNVRTDKHIIFTKHRDQEFDCKVAVFYLNSNDGYTLINNKKIKSVKNRMLFFNNDWHSSSTTTDQPNRIVINFNYF